MYINALKNIFPFNAEAERKELTAENAGFIINITKKQGIVERVYNAIFL